MDLPVTWLMNSIRNDMKHYLFPATYAHKIYTINIYYFYMFLEVR